MLVLLAVLGSLTWAALRGRPESALHPRQFSGSMVLEDYRPLTVVDLASATVTVRLQGVDAEVGAVTYRDVQAVPVAGGTMLVNRRNGTFNLLEPDDYVLDPRGGGVGLGPLAGMKGAEGYASGSEIYIVRDAPTSTVSLVGEAQLRSAGRSERPKGSMALGFATVPGSVSTRPGAAAVSHGSLWALTSCRQRVLLETGFTKPRSRGWARRGRRFRTARSRARARRSKPPEPLSAGRLREGSRCSRTRTRPRLGGEQHRRYACFPGFEPSDFLPPAR